MVKRIRILKVDFSEDISHVEVPKFRGAIIQQVNGDDGSTVLFHNHLEDGSLRKKYPLIQYKRNREKAQIVCLDVGVDEINKLFIKNSFQLKLGNRSISTEIDDIHLKTHILQVWDTMFRFKIRDWLALNQKNYMLYRAIETDEDKKLFLEGILKGNILSMAKGLEWHVDKEIKLVIHKIERSKTLKYRDAEMMGFDVVFSSNVSLPNWIGMGKGSSIGFGIIQQLGNKNQNEN